jgi:hypothetical protein
VKQSVNPVKAAVAAVVVLAALGLIGYKMFGSGSSSLPQANVRPADANDERFKPKLPDGVGGSG